METYGVLKVLSLVVVWGIPTAAVLGVVAFIILAPAFAFAGLARKLGVTIGRHKYSQKTGLKAPAPA